MTSGSHAVHMLVTGATRGIGAAVLQALPNGAVRAVGHGRKPDAPDMLAADLSLPGAAEGLWEEALERLDGRIDVLVNNAGVFEAVDVEAPLAEWHLAWQRSLQINLQAAADLSRHAVLHFQQREQDPASGERGRIVNVASRAAYRGDSPLHWHYAAAKAGLVGMSKSIARGYAYQGIGCFVVAPGFTRTDMAKSLVDCAFDDPLIADIPLGRVAEASEVAETILYLALKAPLAMTGAVLDINGASYVR